MDRMDRESAHAKLMEYRNFADNVLRPQLLQAKASKQSIQQEIDEYRELLEQLQHKPCGGVGGGGEKDNENLIQVDLGHGKVFCEAKTEHVDTTTIFIHVGMGFHVELTIVEGISFIRKRLHYLDQVLKHRDSKVKRIEEHVASSEYILNELSKNLQSLY